MSAIASPSITTDEPSIDDLKADFDDAFASDDGYRADVEDMTPGCTVTCLL